MSDVLQQRWCLVGVAIVLIVGAFYLWGTVRCGEFGFPLDDGWIHQTYARNLAQTGQFAYVPGQISAGSTSPLWTLLLTLGHLLRLPPTMWAYFLGLVCWFLSGWVGIALVRLVYPAARPAGVWIGMACWLEWHMAWAALSGMETMLFVLLMLALIERYAARAHPFLLGLVSGALFLARPEGAVLVVLVGIVLLVDRATRAGPAPSGVWSKSLLVVLADLGAGLALLVIPYLVFNLYASGSILPNTFYAKQTEYRTVLAQPFLLRLWRVARHPLVGGQVLLLPGFVWETVHLIRSRIRGRRDQGGTSSWLKLLPVVWWVVYLLIYALRLPVDYQHGRYVMPTIPFLVLYGGVGTYRLLCPHSSRLVVRVLSRAAPLAVGCLLVAFLLLGGQAYADDVCIINGEMVAVARWLNAHTPPDALLAAHDIGAIGYLGERPLLDLAGLVTPEVIPFMRDEARLTQFVLDSQAAYLVTFPSWYPQMVADPHFDLVYQTDCAVTREKGGDNMAVYKIQR